MGYKLRSWGGGGGEVFLLQALGLALYSFLGKSVLSAKLSIALRPSVRGQAEP